MSFVTLQLFYHLRDRGKFPVTGLKQNILTRKQSNVIFEPRGGHNVKLKQRSLRDV